MPCSMTRLKSRNKGLLRTTHGKGSTKLAATSKLITLPPLPQNARMWAMRVRLLHKLQVGLEPLPQPMTPVGQVER